MDSVRVYLKTAIEYAFTLGIICHTLLPEVVMKPRLFQGWNPLLSTWKLVYSTNGRLASSLQFLLLVSIPTVKLIPCLSEQNPSGVRTYLSKVGMLLCFKRLWESYEKLWWGEKKNSTSTTIMNKKHKQN